MKLNILFSGASSFTGFWFVKALVAQRHRVTAFLKRPKTSYEGTRKERVEALYSLCEVIDNCPYGSETFFTLLNHPFNVFCHHAADVTNYKSPDFDPVEALKNNVGPIQRLLVTLEKKGCQRLVLTGSVFEPGEGAGSDQLRAVSPYGLSKGLTWQMFTYYASLTGISLGKFVIPNPFGPYEELRFTSLVAQHWLEEKPFHVSMPLYVRDNIHVSLLAKAYAQFVEDMPTEGSIHRINPSGYPESQGAFMARFAQEMRKRWNKPCAYTLATKQAFTEPKVRINTDVLNPEFLAWNEEKSWDALANYYLSAFPCLSVL